ncbi:MAG TPA: hypothetical protein VFI65_26775 [Streptosporangiaceae bacterium]|nr:hypothetical protein [Streptosporangiaceae bacterium]
MRHLVGVILAVALAATMLFAGAWGVGRILVLRGAVTATGTSHALTTPRGLFAVGAVLVTGLVIGIFLAVPTISPLATGLPGIVLVAWSTLVVLHNQYAARYLPLPSTHFGTGFTFLLFSGILGMIGAAMVIPLAIPSRWRRAVYEDDDLDPEDIDVQAELGLIP